MDRDYLSKRNKRVINSIAKIFTQMVLITLLVCAAECGLLVRLFNYIMINRFDMIAFTIVTGSFFGILYIQILKNAYERMEREQRMYKFCVDCAIEHETIPYRKALALLQEKPMKTLEIKKDNVILFAGKAKNFEGFKEKEDANTKPKARQNSKRRTNRRNNA